MKIGTLEPPRLIRMRNEKRAARRARRRRRRRREAIIKGARARERVGVV